MTFFLKYQASIKRMWRSDPPLLCRCYIKLQLHKRSCYFWQLKSCCVFNEVLTAPRPATLISNNPRRNHYAPNIKQTYNNKIPLSSFCFFKKYHGLKLLSFNDDTGAIFCSQKEKTVSLNFFKSLSLLIVKSY